MDFVETPIVSITPNSIKASDGIEYQLDIMIFATGFDAIGGNYTRIEICGKNGKTLNEHWKAGSACYLGINIAHFQTSSSLQELKASFATFRQPSKLMLHPDCLLELELAKEYFVEA